MNHFRLFAEIGVLLMLLVAGWAKGEDSSTVTPLGPRLPRENLMLWRDGNQEIHPVTSIADWQKRRREILQGMQSVMGPLPGAEKRCDLDMQVTKEIDCGSYVRRSITYQSEPGSRVPAYLCVPKSVLNGSEKAPAVLCLHPTNNKIGYDVVVGLGGDPGRAYAAELADHGFVTIAPSYPLLASYQPDLKALGYVSGTMKAIWDNMRAVDLLDTLPFVKTVRYGVIGHSLGGHNAVYTAVFDQRLVVAVSSCGLDSFLDYMHGKPEVWQPGKGWCQERYMPRLLRYQDRLDQIPFDFHELVGALAPRSVFISAPLDDGNFQWQSVDRIGKAAEKVYQLYGRPEALHIEHPPGPHAFPDAMRTQAYELLEKSLR